MNEMLKFEEVEKRVITIREQQVLLDMDVAELYGVETKRVNEAVANNPDKFPEGYIISLSLKEWNNLKSKISTSSWGGKNKPPKAFTEKGLYMLATILKSSTATQTTIAIVETFTKIRELSRTISQLPNIQEEAEQKSLMQRSGEILAEVLDNNALEISGDETTIELNLAIMKIKHTVKRGKMY
ncbi:MAG: ORF6N domain-containing protein [Oscillospiraceae bacterium]|nr:ORF6N domain-containing protein [Oscillospiraceae bacterium]